MATAVTRQIFNDTSYKYQATFMIYVGLFSKMLPYYLFVSWHRKQFPLVSISESQRAVLSDFC